MADEVERGWIGTFVEGEGFHFERTIRGVKDVAIIDTALLGSADARKLDEYASSLQEAYPRPDAGRRPATLQRSWRDEPGAIVGGDHALSCRKAVKTWMAGTSPAMTVEDAEVLCLKKTKSDSLGSSPRMTK